MCQKGLLLRFLLVSLLVLLALLHQDFWWWDDPTPVLGFLPIGLAYHALYSILAAVVWALAVKFAWPSEVEVWANAGAQGPTEDDTTDDDKTGDDKDDDAEGDEA